MKGLRDITSFGKVEAEDDAVLDYFVEMNVAKNMDISDTFLVLGRKGSGKTALFRYFTEKLQVDFSSALNLNGYPWKVHEQIKDNGVESVESYVASWKYLIAVEFAKIIVKLSTRYQMTEIIELKKFLNDNYGTSSPEIKNIFSPTGLKVSGDLEPQILGCKIGKISFAKRDDLQLGAELNALTDKILTYVNKAAMASEINKVFLHFDELDRGLTSLSESRKDMIIGLVLASKEVRKLLKGSSTIFKSVVYLRRDIWDELKFSDKNKISSSNSEFIEWDQSQLFALIEKRIKVLFGDNYRWANIDDGKRINKQPKWKHIIERTLLRPRDVISFLNTLLEVTRKRDDDNLLFENRDVVEARPKYSEYLKKELDDEILPHWKDWEVCLQALSRIGKVYFKKDDYAAVYASISPNNEKTYSEEQSLEELYEFSVIEYEARSGYGGSGWKSKFANPELGWDANANRFKVHLGLKEYMKLKEERT
ncbi:MAG: P-loop ATPase, Sll1717 family [Methylobacter sp.]